MKIGIITISQGTNYGNRLQMYAVQQVLHKMGHESYLIENKTHAHGIIYQVKHRLKILLGYKNARYEFYRHKQFKKFDTRFIKIAKLSFNEKYKNSNIASHFDVFLCGSDQVWNPYSPLVNGGSFAAFPNVKRRISYSASFGVENIPEEMKDYYAKWIRGIDDISVRENSGKEIVFDLAQKEAHVLVDPTMMLNAEEWANIEESPASVPKKKYLFKYFLGELSEEVKQHINDLQSKYDLELVDILPNKGEVNYRLNPSHFIFLLHHAEIIVTDSFHASVFALLFNRPLHVFDRVDKKINMSTRLDTLFGLFNSIDVRNNFNLVYSRDVDYKANDILQCERNKAYTFLKNAIKGEVSKNEFKNRF